MEWPQFETSSRNKMIHKVEPEVVEENEEQLEHYRFVHFRHKSYQYVYYEKHTVKQ